MFRGFAFVDWDDTIAENISHFERSEQEMSRLMARWLGLTAEEVLAHGRRLDLEAARQMGLVRASFPTAWTRCYDELCARAGRPPDPALRRQLWQIADATYEREQTLMPGAGLTLDWLRGAGFELTVWTAGDPATQGAKIERSGLGPLFHRRAVVPHKDPEALLRALDGRPPERTVVIGNSRSSDVQPALAVGALAVHVPAETWAYDECAVDDTHPRYVRVERLEQVPAVVGPRFGLAHRYAI